MNSTSTLHIALEDVAPIHGVSIQSWDDKSTWRVDFKDEATKEQRDAAQAVVDDFDPDDPKHQPEPERDLLAEVDVLKAEVEALKAK